MRILIFFLLLANVLTVHSQQLYQLAPPVLKYSSVFFAKEANLNILFNQPNAEIRYTTDGTEPTKNSLLYNGAISATSDAVTLKAKSFASGFIPSETVNATFIQSGMPVKKITTTTTNQKYRGSGPNALHNGLGGVLNSGSKNWLGFNTDTVVIDIDLAAITTVSKIKVHLLEQQNAWIFKPVQIRLQAIREDIDVYETLSKWESNTREQNGTHYTTIELTCSAVKTRTDKLRLVILPVNNIPDWHDGKGQHGWFFIDEINVY
jgi:hypothetical protein